MNIADATILADAETVELPNIIRIFIGVIVGTEMFEIPEKGFFTMEIISFFQKFPAFADILVCWSQTSQKIFR